MAIFTALGAAFSSLFAGGALKTFLIKTLARVAVSAIVRKLSQKDQPSSYGTNGKLQAGDETPRQAPFGVGAAEGSLVYASYWGNSGLPNSHLTQVIALSDLPVKGLLRVMIDGVYVTLDAAPTVGEEDLGLAVVEFRVSGKNHAWVKFYDGTQTVADSLLTGRGEHPDYPWDATAIGVGVAYAVVTARINDELFSGFPRFRFVLDSVKLYDPSRDTTVGGSGSQRWSNPATWGGDGDYLPVVQAYNIMRGVRYAGQWIYGFQRLSSGQLPVAAWIAEIEKCRATVTNSASANEPRFRSGGVLSFATECGTALEAIMASAAGRIMEIGGVYKPQVGIMPAPAMSLTDDQITTTEGQQHSPFKRLSETINAVSAQYPEPDEGYALKAAPTIFNPTYEAQDGGRRLPSQITLENVPYKDQVQRIVAIALLEARRERRHAFVLPPEFYLLEPGDVISYTSAAHGYASKPFRIEAVEMRPDCHVMVDVIEIDDSGVNFDAWDGYRPVTPTPIYPANPSAAVLFEFTATPGAVLDSAGVQRRPSIEPRWTLPDVSAFRGVEIQLALAAFPSAITVYTTAGNQTGMSLASGILPETDYLVRGAPITGTRREFSAWIAVRTGNYRIAEADLASALATKINGAVSTANSALSAHNALVAGFSGTLVDGFNSVNTDITALEAEQATFATSLGGLSTNVTRILGVRSDLLAGTALAALLTQLQVSTSTGLSAFATTQAAAVADLQGNASASYAFRVGAGGASAGLELVAFNDAESGPSSALILSARHVEIQASSLRISDSANLYPDFDMTDANFYQSSTSSGFTRIGTASANLGRFYLNIPSSVADEDAFSGWFPVEPLTEYLVTSSAFLSVGAGGGSVTVYVDFGEVSSGGVISESGSLMIQARSNSTTVTRGTASVTTGTLHKRMRFRVVRTGGGTGAGRAGGFKVQKKTGSVLISDGAVLATHVNTGSFSAAGLAVFGGTLQSANYAEAAGIPTAGWKLDQTGTFRGKNIILRDAVTAGAVSDETFSDLAGPVNIPTGLDQVIASHSTGPVPFGSILMRGILFEMRHVSPGGYPTDLVFRNRRKFGGIWSAWTTLGSWSFGPTENFADWRMLTDSGTLVGAYEDVEYQLISSRGSGAAISGIRNLRITTKNLVR